MELREYKFFEELSNKELQEIEKVSKYITIPKNKMLYYQGEINEAILFLKKGKVKVYLQSPNNISSSEITLYQIGVGEQCLINTISTITQNKTLASAIVIQEVEGWLIPRDNILWLLNNSLKYRNFKIELCTKRFTNLLALISSLKFDQLEQRVLNWLYIQGEEVIETTHENIAKFLGVTREAISRNLKNLEKSGLIELNRGIIRIIL